MSSLLVMLRTNKKANSQMIKSGLRIPNLPIVGMLGKIFGGSFNILMNG